jgi:hypothetical protein
MSIMAGMEKRRANRLLVRVPRLILLVAIALFYLQFGLQALTQFLPQGALALVGAIALGRGAVRSYRGHSVLAIVFIGTVPLLLLHAVMTLLEPGELPFLIGSAPVPVLAGAVWLITGSSRSHN